MATSPEPQLNTTATRWRFGRIDVLCIILLLLIGSALWLPGLGQRGLWTSGEARAAQVARRMVENNDYVTMRVELFEPDYTVAGIEGEDALKYDPNGKTHVYEHQWRQEVLTKLSAGPLQPDILYRQVITIHKPVFYYWLIALAHDLGMDINNFTVRCFSAVPAILLLIITYLLGCVLYDRRVGILAAIGLATCVQYWWQARICQMDMLLALMMSTVFLLWHIGDHTQRTSVRFASFGAIYAILAAASLMKSFAYMLLAGLIILVYLAIKTIGQYPRSQWLRAYGRRVFQTAKRMHVIGGAVIYLILVVPWFVLIDRATDGQYTREMFFTHMFARAGLMQYGREFEATTDWWFYLLRIWADMFPWVIMIPGAIVQVFRKRCRDTWQSGAYLLSWFIVWFVFFSAMHFRKGEYILPLYPAAMILVAKMLIDFVGDQATDIHLGRAIRSAFVALAIGIVGAAAFAFALTSKGFMDWLTKPRGEDNEPIFGGNLNDITAFNALANFLQTHLAATVTGIVLLVLAMIVAVVLAHRKRAGYAIGLLTAGTAFAMLVGTHVFMDRIVNPLRSQRVFVERIEPHLEKLSSNRRAILFGSEQYEMTYLLPNRFDAVRWVKDAPNVTRSLWAIKSRLATETEPALVVMTREHWGQIVEANAYYAKQYNKADPWVDQFAEVQLGLDDNYNRRHREPLILLQFTPTPAGLKS